MTIQWQQATDFSINPKKIDVWYIDIKNFSTQLADFHVLLDADEVSRFNRYKFKNDQQRFLVTHGALRNLLSLYLNCPVKTIDFQRNNYGKPSVLINRQLSELTFNLSHRSDYALIAITKNQAVGIDIELLNDHALLDDIVNRFFSEDEKEEYQQLPSNQKLQGFYLAWTRKEAFIKTTGLGMMFSLKHFSVNLTPGVPPSIRSINKNIIKDQSWQMHSFFPNTDTCAALCWSGNANTLNFYQYMGN